HIISRPLTVRYYSILLFPIRKGLFYHKFQRPVEGQTDGKVSHAVDQVEGNAGDPVGEGRRRPAGKAVGQGAEGAEEKAEEAGEDGKKQGGVLLSEGKHRQGQSRPDI